MEPGEGPGTLLPLWYLERPEDFPELAESPALRGYIAGILGLMVAMIGSDGIHAHVRFNLGIEDLNGGIGLIPAMVGASASPRC